jgi:ABC-type sugar transport system substrate-binding protein
MRIRLRRTDGVAVRGRAARGTIAVVAVCALVAACGTDTDDDAAGSPGTGGTGGSQEEIDVDDEQVQELVDRAFLADVSLDELPDIVQTAFRRATLELDDEKLDKAFECWEAASCDVGDGDVILGIADGFGQNQWRKFSRMEAILQAMTYPQIGKILSTDAQGDLAQMQSNIRSLAAQGATAIITYNDFGPAALPAFAAAAQQGAKISSYVGPTPDAPEDAIHNQVHGDTCEVGAEMAEVGQAELGLSGEVAIFNGTPGNPQGQSWNKCFEDELTDITVGTKLDTSWTPAGVFEAASALVSSGKDYAGIFYDYADPMPQIVQAYESAGKVTPPLVTWTSNNGLFKEWEERQGTDKAFELYFTNGLNWQARVSVTAVMSLLDGEEVENDVIVPQPFVKAEAGIYDANRPDDYPGPSVLVPDSVVDRMLR